MISKKEARWVAESVATSSRARREYEKFLRAYKRAYKAQLELFLTAGVPAPQDHDLNKNLVAIDDLLRIEMGIYVEDD